MGSYQELICINTVYTQAISGQVPIQKAPTLHNNSNNNIVDVVDDMNINLNAFDKIFNIFRTSMHAFSLKLIFVNKCAYVCVCVFGVQFYC